jgi:hypothetical protein
MVLDQRAKVRSQDSEEGRVKTRDRPDQAAAAEAVAVDRVGVKAAGKDRAGAAEKGVARGKVGIQAEIRNS